MLAEIHDLSLPELLGVLAGSPAMRARLTAGEHLRAETPFSYPGRQGPLIVHLTPLPEAELAEASPGEPPRSKPPARQVRISDGGGLIKSLGEQGMELEVDMILSRTVFHAVRQREGAGITGGQVFLDGTTETIGADLWRFLQMVAEIIGLRHAKYKDALVQLERRKDTEAGVVGWWPR